jgi:hypothetical protein
LLCHSSLSSSSLETPFSRLACCGWAGVRLVYSIDMRGPTACSVRSSTTFCTPVFLASPSFGFVSSSHDLSSLIRLTHHDCPRPVLQVSPLSDLARRLVALLTSPCPSSPVAAKSSETAGPASCNCWKQATLKGSSAPCSPTPYCLADQDLGERREALDGLGLKRYCCRRMILTHVDLIEKLLHCAFPDTLLLTLAELVADPFFCLSLRRQP